MHTEVVYRGLTAPRHFQAFLYGLKGSSGSFRIRVVLIVRSTKKSFSAQKTNFAGNIPAHSPSSRGSSWCTPRFSFADLCFWDLACLSAAGDIGYQGDFSPSIDADDVGGSCIRSLLLHCRIEPLIHCPTRNTQRIPVLSLRPLYSQLQSSVFAQFITENEFIIELSVKLVYGLYCAHNLGTNSANH